MVLATQNPIEQFGTYPLPEAQLDRFMMKISMGYPDFEQEVNVLKLDEDEKKSVRPVLRGSDVVVLRQAVKAVEVSDMVYRYIVQIVKATRDNGEVLVGSSPRGGLALRDLSKALALSRGRGYVLPDDVKEIAPCVLRHRLILSHEAKSAKRSADDVIASVLGGISVPVIDVGKREAGGER